MAITLVVESGQGLNNANSYVSIQPTTYQDGTGGTFPFSVDQYFADRMVPTEPPNQVWFPPPAPDQADPNLELKKALLIRATAYLDSYWHAVFKGMKKTQVQRLCWPRVGATIEEGGYDAYVMFWPGYSKTSSAYLLADNQIPIQVLECCCELASRSAMTGAFTAPGELAPDVTADQYIKREHVGAIEIEYSETGGSSGRPTSKIYSYCNMLLAPVLKGSGSQIPLVRG